MGRGWIPFCPFTACVRFSCLFSYTLHFLHLLRSDFCHGVFVRVQLDDSLAWWNRDRFDDECECIYVQASAACRWGAETRWAAGAAGPEEGLGDGEGGE